MSTPFLTFEEKTRNCTSKYRFYEDRIERDWRVIIRHGTDVLPVTDLSEHISEQTTFTHGVRGGLRQLGFYVLFGLVLHLGFENEILQKVGFVLYGLAGIAALSVSLKLRRDTWLYVKRTDGQTLLTLREKGLTGITRDDLAKALSRYVRD